ncbi:hypothetical protein OBBRIDRAFT_861229 [Obba rivulosa]|uniref:Uncharacterized protein n=1 Tax=Obba rivulosa TaxID=1052685 RepID=A0A8E2B325_9APHY|nr:hypothetical protein OBBRIDRAFT_861229 [Obba rivulosa]
MVDPFAVAKCAGAIITYAWKHGPTHRLDKAKQHLSSSLDEIENHRFFKDDKEVERMIAQYDRICVAVNDVNADYVSRPIYLKVAPKVLNDAKTVKKRAKQLHVLAKASSDQAKRKALLQPFGSPHEALETVSPRAMNSVGGVSANKKVTLAVSAAKTPDDGDDQASPAFRITTTTSMLERHCPGASDHLYVPVGSTASDLEPPIVYVSPSVFCNILHQIAAAAASGEIVEQDYPMGDETLTSP